MKQEMKLIIIRMRRNALKKYCVQFISNERDTKLARKGNISKRITRNSNSECFYERIEMNPT